ncbi:GNAT family N-acetyltransferase [Aquincola sp. S2]|uniref:GNAT family N-acetyltransferase n=1 Tax=Pseudaquabacterium terrae TaxID=2732868 RepID=A0ABX2EDH5_9BURK|nr:GNAT family N-acetyltransferase [Aquabacterium terrae]NRF66298.1 GNAT family N-acetyltransferase [Aquabacterium terrae]
MEILTTARLRLREFDENDAAFIHALLTDPAWIANIGDRGIRSTEDARIYIRDKLVENYERLGYGFWAVERLSDGLLIGMCGLTQRESLPAPDIGYALLPAWRGSGYAREAAAACLHHAREVLRLPRVLATIAPENAASARVLESIGLRPEGRVHNEFGESCLFGWPAGA